MSSAVNSPSSFIEEGDLFLEDVPKKWLDPGKFLKEKENALEKKFRSGKMLYDTLINETKEKLCRAEEQIKAKSELVEKLCHKKSQLTTLIIEKRLSVNELLIKKKTLQDNNFAGPTDQELTEMLEKVLALEKEKENNINEMKSLKKCLVSQMCFYKNYLDVYIDMPKESDYTLYYQRCKGHDTIKPKCWIRILTDDFKIYDVGDISLPEDSNERSSIMKLCEDGIHLRQLIYKARRYCLQ